jgi:hypothetical protein
MVDVQLEPLVYALTDDQLWVLTGCQYLPGWLVGPGVSWTAHLTWAARMILADRPQAAVKRLLIEGVRPYDASWASKLLRPRSSRQGGAPLLNRRDSFGQGGSSLREPSNRHVTAVSSELRLPP